MSLAGDFIKALLAVSFAAIATYALWPDGIFDLALGQWTLRIVLELIGVAALWLWAVPNLYNRLGPHCVSWALRKNSGE